MATAEFSKFAGVLSAALSQHHLSDRKRKEIMPFAVTWKDLEIIILNEVRQRKT